MAERDAPEAERRRVVLANSPTRTAVESGAVASDAFRVRVHVLDPEGHYRTDGLLRCYWGPRSHPELRDATDFAVDLRTASNPVELDLPAGEVAGFGAIAFVPGHDPVREAVTDLHWLGESRGRRSGGVLWEFVLVVPGAGDDRLVQGRVLVDGVPSVPDGLRAVLEQERPSSRSASAEERMAQRDQLAFIDAAEARYWVGPLTERAEGLWVTSDETASLWLPPEALSTEFAVALDLRTHGVLRLLVIDGTSKQPLPDLALALESLVLTTVSQRRKSFRGSSRVSRTDGAGRARIAGLTPDGRIIVWAEHRDGRRERLVDEYVASLDLSRELVVEARPDGPAPRGEAWGRVAEAPPSLQSPPCSALGESGGEPTRSVVYRRESPGEPGDARRKTLDPLDGSWRVSAKPGVYSFWIEQQGARLTEFVPVEIRAADSVGPVEFSWADVSEMTFEWECGSVGTTLELALLAGGEDEFAGRATLELGSRDGSCSIPIGPARPTRFRIRLSPEVEETVQFWDGEVLPDEQRVLASFCAGEPQRQRVQINGEHPKGAGRLLVVGTSTQGGRVVTIQTSVATDDGLSSARVYVPEDERYFVYHGADLPNAVLGRRFDVSDGEVLADWSGSMVSRSELGIGPERSSVQIDTLDGEPLVGAAAELAATVVLPTDGAPEGREILWDLDSYGW